jgi:hypothetical protein
MRLFFALYGFVLACLVALAIAGGVVVFGRSGPDGPIAALGARYDYNIPAWELRHFLGKFLYGLGHLFDGGPSPAEEDAIIRRYFRAGEEIEALDQALTERSAPEAQSRLAQVRQERRDLENQVEAILERRLSEMFREQGLTVSPPLFDDWALVFPPVDFEFDSPPQLLVISPRDRIYRQASYTLRHGLAVEEIAAIEAEAEATGVSALVVTTGGIATYPSVVPEMTDMPDAVQVAIHEWLHQYLALHPLGRRYFASNEVQTLNETVANMAAAELAGMLLPDMAPPPPTETAPPSAGGFDFRREMRALRLKVETLLADGKMEAAERLMEAKRQVFVEHGYYIRRINQAYFAFHGTYADTPASIDPVGPKLQALRRRLPSVREFVRLAASFSGLEDLDRAVAELVVGQPTG